MSEATDKMKDQVQVYLTPPFPPHPPLLCSSYSYGFSGPEPTGPLHEDNLMTTGDDCIPFRPPCQGDKQLSSGRCHPSNVTPVLPHPPPFGPPPWTSSGTGVSLLSIPCLFLSIVGELKGETGKGDPVPFGVDSPRCG